jgi:hypothetical protein
MNYSGSANIPVMIWKGWSLHSETPLETVSRPCHFQEALGERPRSEREMTGNSR